MSQSNTEISNRHPEYDANVFTWRQVRDCVEGEAQVKRRDEVYLPMPSGMIDAPPPSNQGNSAGSLNKDGTLDTTLNPNYHSNPAYRAYKTRAHFPDITGFTVRGLMGVATRKPPTIDVGGDDGFEKLLQDAYVRTLNENIQTGRVPVLVDVTKDGDFIILPIKAETMINWEVDDEGKLTRIVFEETSLAKGEEVIEYRELSIEQLEEGGPTAYTNSLYDSDGNLKKPPMQPNVRGKTIDFIPIVIVGSTDITPEPDIIPMGSISSVSLQIYMKSADLSQAEFLTCNPTLVLSGVSADDLPKVVGSTVVLALPEHQSKAYYTETDTGGLGHVLNRMESFYEQAVAYGANLLGGGKKSAESGEALRLRQTASSATLQSLVTTTGKGMQECLDMMARWEGKKESEHTFEAVKELSDLVLSAQEMTALVNGWMAGALTLESVVGVFQRMGLLFDGRTVEEEITAIAEAGPAIPIEEDKGESEEDEFELDKDGKVLLDKDGKPVKKVKE